VPKPDINYAWLGSAIKPEFVMTITEDPVDATATEATIAEMSDELIFLIASAATDEQRKYAADLFRYFARAVARDAYQQGQRDQAAGGDDAVSIVPCAIAENEN
jgi:hypothetical protein